MSFSYFCAIDFHFSKGGEKKSLYSSASKWTQEACPNCPARGQQDCCSLPHLRTRSNSGQQQTIALGCEPLEGKEVHTLPRSFKDSWQQQRRFGSSVLFLGIISCPARKGSACCLVPLCICPRPISTLHPCPGQTRTEAPLPSFSHWFPLLLRWL